MHKTGWLILSLLVSLPMYAGSALAENPEGPDYQVGGSQIDLHRRFPGDRSLDNGNVRHQGPERGAYVERCYWFRARDVSRSAVRFRATLRTAHP